MFDQEKLRSLKAQRAQWEETTLQATLDRFPERRERSSPPPASRWSGSTRRWTWPTWTTSATWAFPASTPSPAASTPPCTAAGCGRCACSPASAPPRRPTPASSTCWSRADRPLRRLRPAHARWATTPTRPRRWASSASAAWPSSSLADMEILFDGIPLDEVTTSHDHQQPGGHHLGHVHRRGRKAGRAHGRAARHHPERHPQGVHRPEGVHLPARALHAAGDRHHRVRQPSTCRSGTPSASAATTSARPARPPRRSWPSPWPTAWSTCAGASSAGWTWTTSRPRLSFFFNVAQRLLRGDRQVPRRPPHLGARDARDLWRQEPALLAAALPHPDGRLSA